MEYENVFHTILPSMSSKMSRMVGSCSKPDCEHHKIVESILKLAGLRGIDPFYGLIGGWLGIEPSHLLIAIGVIWALSKVLRQLYNFLRGVVTEHFMSSVQVSSRDTACRYLLDWLDSQPTMANSRHLKAERMITKTEWIEDDKSLLGRDRSGRYINYSSIPTRIKPRYDPAVGKHSFWWQGRYYRLRRKQKTLFTEPSQGQSVFLNQDDIIISCFGRSPEPIKHLLAHTREQWFAARQNTTTIQRPSHKKSSWKTVADRHARDISTVILDAAQKQRVLADLNEYLHPDTARWYASRGIFLRRGYLFHGPPGTGKTSLAFALAGVFGLGIHIISLLEPSLTEEELCTLFAELPRRCIVLLEDIDTAGLQRAEDPTPTPNPNNPDPSLPTHAHAAAAAATSGVQRTGISLSGLLNAIDGVGSHEGHLLILTSNSPEQLDSALIRPGRVDLQVSFTNATRIQAAGLFVSMYQHSSLSSPPYSSPSPATSSASCSEVEATNKSLTATITPDTLSALAEAFGAKIPEGQFSPAQIQGYLLNRKTAPRQALEEADAWVDGVMRQKERNSKVLGLDFF